MKCNVRPIDAGIRAGAGLALLASPLLNFQTLPFNWLGLIPIGTALLGYCPLYALFRAVVPASGNTNRHAQSHA